MKKEISQWRIYAIEFYLLQVQERLYKGEKFTVVYLNSGVSVAVSYSVSSGGDISAVQYFCVSIYTT